MTLDELQKELALVQDRLAKLDPNSAAYRAGKEIEKAILHSLGVGE